MVDFKKRIGKKTASKVVDPLKLYESLDRASDKGPLRPIQEKVLSDWHTNRRGEQDVILKMHTGQGKTLVGLLMLQSKLNEGVSPALYLCPNNFLVNQTVVQAQAFGIRCVTTVAELPDEFIEGRAILVTVVHKLFNGLTKFGLGTKSLPVGSVCIDDAHAASTRSRTNSLSHSAAASPMSQVLVVILLNSSKTSCVAKGMEALKDIRRNDYNVYLPIPYWEWWDKTSEVARILSRHASTDAIKFAWPLLKDSLRHTLCLVSGTQVVISPYLPPLEQFGSYTNARHRFFMSATITDDSFLVKGFGLTRRQFRIPL